MFIYRNKVLERLLFFYSWLNWIIPSSAITLVTCYNHKNLISNLFFSNKSKRMMMMMMTVIVMGDFDCVEQDATALLLFMIQYSLE